MAIGGFAQAKVDGPLKMGGIAIRNVVMLGRDVALDGLRADCDAVFLGLGLPGVNALRATGEAAAGVRNAHDFIAELRQAARLRRPRHRSGQAAVARWATKT